MSATLPLSRTELAIAELAEMVARGRTPEEVAALGWAFTAELMGQRRRLILDVEIADAESVAGV